MYALHNTQNIMKSILILILKGEKIREVIYIHYYNIKYRYSLVLIFLMAVLTNILSAGICKDTVRCVISWREQSCCQDGCWSAAQEHAHIQRCKRQSTVSTEVACISRGCKIIR